MKTIIKVIIIQVLSVTASQLYSQGSVRPTVQEDPYLLLAEESFDIYFEKNKSSTQPFQFYLKNHSSGSITELSFSESDTLLVWDTIAISSTYDPALMIFSVNCIVNRERNGYFYRFHKNLKLSRQGYFKNGLQEGVEYSFLNKKLTMERNFRNGKLHGFFYSYYYANGSLGSSSHYINGFRTGLEITYFKSGQVSRRKSIEDFQAHGLTTVYNKRGKVIKYLMYEYDKLIWEKSPEEYMEEYNSTFK